MQGSEGLRAIFGANTGLKRLRPHLKQHLDQLQLHLNQLQLLQTQQLQDLARAHEELARASEGGRGRAKRRKTEGVKPGAAERLRRQQEMDQQLLKQMEEQLSHIQQYTNNNLSTFKQVATSPPLQGQVALGMGMGVVPLAISLPQVVGPGGVATQDMQETPKQLMQVGETAGGTGGAGGAGAEAGAMQVDEGGGGARGAGAEAGAIQVDEGAGGSGSAGAKAGANKAEAKAKRGSSPNPACFTLRSALRWLTTDHTLRLLAPSRAPGGGQEQT